MIKIALIVSLLLVGCATWQDTTRATLEGIHLAAKKTSEVAEPAYDRKCSAVATKCKELGDVVCKGLSECADDLRELNNVIVSIHIAVATGLSLVALDSKDSAAELVGKLLVLFQRMNQLAHSEGVLQWTR